MIKLMATCLKNLTRLSLRALVKTSLAAMTALMLSAYTHANVDRVTYLHYDGLGSAIAATDEQGAIKWRENYQPYGQRTKYETDNHTVWFTGKPEEADFELQYYGGRWYDPNLGRFNSIDPQGFVESSPMSFNRYAYANNNPYSYVDPDGELPFLVPLAIFLVKEAAAEVASHYTNGWSDFLSVRRMVTGGARYLSRTLRRGDDLPHQVVRNNQAGTLGENAVRSRLERNSSIDVVGEQIRIRTPGLGSHRVTDFLVRGRTTGRLRIVEVKTGGATRGSMQRAKDNMIADPMSETYFFGRRSRDAGFFDGELTGSIRTYEVNASNLNR